MRRFTSIAVISALLRVADSAVAADAPAPQRDAKGDFIVPSRAAFLNLLDWRKPGLASVKAALDAGEVEAASAAYAAHFRAKEIRSPLFQDWEAIERAPGYNTSAADRLLAGHFRDGYSVYDVPPTGLDWRNSPLSCVTRFPILRTLRYVIHHTQDPKYIRFVVDHILGYMAAYPIAEFAGRRTTEGWTNHTTVAKPWYWCMLPERLMQLSQTVALIRRCPAVTDEELLRILQRMHEETTYLRSEITPWVDRRHNGGCAMIQGMAQSCAILADFARSREWLAYDAELAAQYIRRAFYPDGMCVELTVAYSASVSLAQQRLAYLLREEQAIRDLRERLAAMATCMVGLGDPTGRLPSFGDLRASTLRRSIHQPLVDWLGLSWVKTATHGADGPPPPFTVWPAPGQEQWCGYYTMRSDWTPGARYLAIDGGPWGTTHRHGDKLSFVVTALGARFIVDPSSTKYASNRPDAFIGGQPSGFLHNTITIDGVDEFQSEGSIAEAKAPLSNVWEHGERHSLFVGSFTFSPVKPVTWERRIVFVAGSYWLLQDVVTGGQDSARLEQNFQFQADVRVSFEGDLTVATAPNGARLALVPLNGPLTPQLTIGDKTPHTTYWPAGKPTQVLRREDNHDQKHGRGWSGRAGYKLTPAPAVTYVGEVKLPAVLTTLLAPLEQGQTLDDLPSVRSAPEGDKIVWTLPAGDGAVRFAASRAGCAVLP